MVKTYIPEEIIATYNKGKGIDRKEYEFITDTKKAPDWMHIPANGMTQPTGDPGMADFSEVAPFNAANMMGPPQSPMPIAPPPLPAPPPPPMLPPSSMPPTPMAQSVGGPPPPIPMAITG